MPDAYTPPIRYPGKPTWYKGWEFRSRAEARWGVFYDFLKWRWDPETDFSITRYLEDFLLFRPKRPILVEVKGGILTLDELRPFFSKIEESGWIGRALIVGASPDAFNENNELVLGLLCDIPHARTPADPPWAWSPVTLDQCSVCQTFSILEAACEHPEAVQPVTYEAGRQLWNRACSRVKWQPTPAVHYNPPPAGTDSTPAGTDSTPAPDALAAKCRKWLESHFGTVTDTQVSELTQLMGQPATGTPMEVLAKGSLAEARDIYWTHIDDQMTTCPCCDRTTKRYCRKLSAGMLCGLIMLLRLSKELTTPDNPQGWINLKTKSADGLPAQSLEEVNAFTKLELQKLRFWGMVEAKPKGDGEGHKSGIWRTTQVAVDFAEGRISQPVYCYDYDGEAQWFGPEQFEISHAWEGFNYAELMAAPNHPCRADMPKMKRTAKRSGAKSGKNGERLCSVCQQPGHTKLNHTKWKAEQIQLAEQVLTSVEPTPVVERVDPLCINGHINGVSPEILCTSCRREFVVRGGTSCQTCTEIERAAVESGAVVTWEGDQSF